jgi:hypothetical protein
MLTDAVNNYGGSSVSVFHTSHKEVNSYRTHVWECDGPCKSRAPFFDLVKRSMNRAPGKSDTWRAKHLGECGSSFAKIAKPEIGKEQAERLSGLQKREGRSIRSMGGSRARSAESILQNQTMGLTSRPSLVAGSYRNVESGSVLKRSTQRVKQRFRMRK